MNMMMMMTTLLGSVLLDELKACVLELVWEAAPNGRKEELA
jgi:hypothetical protein